MLSDHATMRQRMLKNSEHDEYYSTGLGLLCQLLTQLSKYLGIQLRARVIPFGSRSKIYDVTTFRAGRQREIPDIYRLYCDKTTSQSNRQTNLAHAFSFLEANIRHMVRECKLKEGDSS